MNLTKKTQIKFLCKNAHPKKPFVSETLFMLEMVQNVLGGI